MYIDGFWNPNLYSGPNCGHQTEKQLPKVLHKEIKIFTRCRVVLCHIMSLVGRQKKYQLESDRNNKDT